VRNAEREEKKIDANTTPGMERILGKRKRGKKRITPIRQRDIIAGKERKPGGVCPKSLWRRDLCQGKWWTWAVG